jgi:regulatory helix-turn-helix LysR family protein
MNSPEARKMGHSSKHIGLDYPKWSLRIDSLGSLNAFVQAAEARSFMIAGRQLGVSPSAIGKAVARIEERLGMRFFPLRSTGPQRI